MKALITGVCGQDGWYLSEFLMGKGYEVIGTRRGNEEPTEVPEGVHCVYGDVTDASCIRSLEVERLCGNASKARAIGWTPTVSFEDMIKEMVDVAIER